MIKSTRMIYKKSDLIAWLSDRFGQDFTLLEQELPPMILRAKWDVLAQKVGLPYTRKYMQNLDCEKKGPFDYINRKGNF